MSACGGWLENSLRLESAPTFTELSLIASFPNVVEIELATSAEPPAAGTDPDESAGDKLLLVACAELPAKPHAADAADADDSADDEPLLSAGGAGWAVDPT